MSTPHLLATAAFALMTAQYEPPPQATYVPPPAPEYAPPQPAAIYDDKIAS